MKYNAAGYNFNTNKDPVQKLHEWAAVLGKTLKWYEHPTKAANGGDVWNCTPMLENEIFAKYVSVDTNKADARKEAAKAMIQAIKDNAVSAIFCGQHSLDLTWDDQ